jgi:NACalpha-BTF3-like transcription factor
VLLDVTAAFPQFEAKNISLVAEQSNRSYEDAAIALCRHDDVVNAIMELTA